VPAPINSAISPYYSHTRQNGVSPEHAGALGIANRVVAVLDNDTAAADALRNYARTALSDNIRVLQYPPLGLAQQYPTLGSPTVGSPAGSIELADVNGLAASIELYLGRDVLTTTDGSLHPVQWTHFIPGMGRYQGEVTSKRHIHEAFRVKAAAALRGRAAVHQQDWDSLRLVLDAILTAFHQPESSSLRPRARWAPRSLLRAWMSARAKEAPGGE
jgi:hypothetical protein